MKKVAIALAFGVFFSTFLLNPAVVLAQTTKSTLKPSSSPATSPAASPLPPLTPTPSPTPTSAADLTPQINTLQTQYRQDLDTYRNDERDYTVAKQQYAQLQTLAALEDAVRKTQKVMLSRLVVLQEYTQLLKLTLTNTHGIDVPVKTAQLAQLDTLTKDLKNHQNIVNAATDRTHLATAASNFATLQPEIESTNYETLSLIAYGKVRAVYDKTTSVEQDIRNNITSTETDPLRLATKNRGFDEIDRNLATVDTDLKKSLQDITRQESSYGASDYSQVLVGLNPSYARISQALSFLKEILNS